MIRLTGAGVIPAMSKPTPPRGLVKDEEPLELPLPLEIAIVNCMFGCCSWCQVCSGVDVRVCVLSECKNKCRVTKLYM